MLQTFTFSTVIRFYIILIKLQLVSKQDACFNVIWIIYCFIIYLNIFVVPDQLQNIDGFIEKVILKSAHH